MISFVPSNRLVNSHELLYLKACSRKCIQWYVRRLQSSWIQVSPPHHRHWSNDKSNNSDRRYFSTIAATEGELLKHDENLWQMSYLSRVEKSVNNVIKKYPSSELKITSLPPMERESLNVARSLKKKFEWMKHRNKCPNCWMLPEYCICKDCGPILHETDSNTSTSVSYKFPFEQVFLLMHHKEVGLSVDTSKMLLLAFPEHFKLVVSGLDASVQDSMNAMNDVLSNKTQNTWILFVSHLAKSWPEWHHDNKENSVNSINSSNTSATRDNLIVLDGTWEQARRMYQKYLVPFVSAESSNNVRAVCLQDHSLDHIKDFECNSSTDQSYTGRQIRHHPNILREIGTLEATRLLLKEVDAYNTDNNKINDNEVIKPWDKLAVYHEKANEAARKQRPIKWRN